MKKDFSSNHDSKHILDLYCFIISHLKGNHIVLKNNKQYSDKYIVQKKLPTFIPKFHLHKKLLLFFQKLYKKDFFK